MSPTSSPANGTILIFARNGLSDTINDPFLCPEMSIKCCLQDNIMPKITVKFSNILVYMQKLFTKVLKPNESAN